MRLYGNRGVFTPDPATVLRAKCDVCGTEMNVERNTLGATSWGEALARRKHLHDRFTYPNYTKAWHQRVADLMSEALEEKGSVRRSLIKKAKGILTKHR